MLNINGKVINSPLDPQIQTLSDVINRITTFMIPLAAVILLFVFIMGGYDVLLSQGNAEKVKSGRMKITAGIIGLVIMVFAYVAARLISGIFGIGQGIFQ